jgi:Uma2 family endonuclease
MEDWSRRNRITVYEYHRMAEAGVFPPGVRVELIEGVIYEMPPIGSRHASIVNRLNALLGRAVGNRAIVSCQQPVQLGQVSEPQPDLALLAPRDDFYEYHLPTAADTLLLIEVSDTTLPTDRHTKLPLYAQHGIPEFWLIDVDDRRLHVFRNPTSTTYAEVTSPHAPSAISIASLPGITIDLSSLGLRS